MLEMSRGRPPLRTSSYMPATPTSLQRLLISGVLTGSLLLLTKNPSWTHFCLMKYNTNFVLIEIKEEVCDSNNHHCSITEIKCILHTNTSTSHGHVTSHMDMQPVTWTCNTWHVGIMKTVASRIVVKKMEPITRFSFSSKFTKLRFKMEHSLLTRAREGKVCITWRNRWCNG